MAHTPPTSVPAKRPRSDAHGWASPACRLPAPGGAPRASRPFPAFPAPAICSASPSQRSQCQSSSVPAVPGALRAGGHSVLPVLAVPAAPRVSPVLSSLATRGSPSAILGAAVLPGHPRRCSPVSPGQLSPVLSLAASRFLCCSRSLPCVPRGRGDIRGTSGGDRGAQGGLCPSRPPRAWAKGGRSGSVTSCGRAGKESMPTGPVAPWLCPVVPVALPTLGTMRAQLGLEPGPCGSVWHQGTRREQLNK